MLVVTSFTKRLSAQIHTTIRNTKGARTSLYGSVPQDAFEMLVKRLVKQLREPASWYVTMNMSCSLFHCANKNLGGAPSHGNKWAFVVATAPALP